MSIISPDSIFFGRKKKLEILKKRVLGLKEGYRQNIALIGNRYVGKTTILHKFLSELDDPGILPIYVDLDNRDFHYFYSKFVGGILYSFARLKHMTHHDDIKVMLEACRNDIPNTVKEIKKIHADMRLGKVSDAYRALINLPEIFASETDTYCVLFLDEFHNLEDMSIPNVFKEMGKKIMTQKRSLYVVTSSFPEVAKRILVEKLSLLFGNFEVVHVEPFDVKTSHKFIRNSLGQINMGLTLRNFLIDFSGGHALYLNLILREIINLTAVHKQSNIFSPLVVQAIENTIFNQWGVLSRHFELSIDNLCANKGNRVVSSILIALSNTKYKSKDLVKHLDAKQSVVTQRVNRLLEMGVIEKNGNFLYLKDKLFRYWVKYVFQKRFTSVDFSYEKLKRQFKSEVYRSIEEFKFNSRKDMSVRIVELMNCFENESFSLGGRKYKLPAFDDIRPVKQRPSAPRSFDVIKATSAAGEWFLVLKRDSFSENDIQNILAEARRCKQKPLKCVMISLNDPDQNARLKALQEKIWIWNESELKALLNYYDKPYIV